MLLPARHTVGRGILWPKLTRVADDERQVPMLGLYDGFETFRTLTDTDYTTVLGSALVVVDTNVLLNLYRYHAETRAAMIQVLGALGDRLFVPHRVMEEFWRNRERAATRPLEDVRTSVRDLGRHFDSIREVLRQWVNRGALAPDAAHQLQEIIDAQAETVASAIQALVDPDQVPATRNTGNDPVLQALEPCLAGRVGPPMPADAYKAALTEGRRRAAAGEPPGFGDQQKSKRDDVVGAAGDYLVWEQTLLAAESRKLDVVIVTADMKPDWWRLEGTFPRGPRTELVAELLTRSGRQLYLMRPEALLEHAATALSVTVEESSVAEVQRAGQDETEDAEFLVGSNALTEALTNAQTLWVETDRLYANLANGVGNQLDTPRGTRVFFGFPPDQVDLNTVLGHIELQVPGFEPETRSVRFGNNAMDKVNLPRPGLRGPANYDNSYLIFDRLGTGASELPLFKLTVTDLEGLEARRGSAINVVDLEMSGGRSYGLMDF